MLKEYKKNFILFSFLQLIWLSHFIQVFVPETGFDAVWYHLPVVKNILKAGKIVFSPELYQSVNPLFSDLIFMIGYFFAGSLGTKIISFVFASLLVLYTYKLSRLFLSLRLSLGITILVSTFQVISWQSSSFYVDVPKAFWEILAIYFLIKDVGNNKISDKVKSILAFSASLATKLFSLFLLPVYFFIFVKYAVERGNYKQVLLLLLLFLFPIFFYINTYLSTGNPFYSFLIHLQKLSQIGGQSNLVDYFINRSFLLFFSPFKLMIVRDYTSILISILLIPLIMKIKKIIVNKELSILLIFSLSQWLLWWYLPPLSTRYALSGFITLILLEIIVLKRYFLQVVDKKITMILVVFAILNFIPRLFVNYRSLKYLLSNQTEKQYIEQFYDGSIDQKLKAWYGYE